MLVSSVRNIGQMFVSQSNFPAYRFAYRSKDPSMSGNAFTLSGDILEGTLCLIIDVECDASIISMRCMTDNHLVGWIEMTIDEIEEGFGCIS